MTHSNLSAVWMIHGNGKSGSRIARLFKELGIAPVRLFSSCEEALLALKWHRPKLIFIEGLQPTIISKVQRIKTASPRTHLVLLTSCDDLEILKTQFSHPFLKSNVDRNPPSDSAKNLYGLSRREQQILQCMVRGLINKEIAESLSISYFTVENHQRKIYEKLNVHTRTAAVTKGLLEKIV